MKTLSKKTVYTYKYWDRGRWQVGCNEAETQSEIQEILSSIGAKKYKILKRVYTTKEKMVAFQW